MPVYRASHEVVLGAASAFDSSTRGSARVTAARFEYE
jgi:hypothetical protein